MIHPSRLSVVSLFSGVGGLDLGFEQEGFHVVWANDIMPAAVKSYRLNFGRDAFAGDITKIATSDIPQADVIVGGPPCQSFSLVGQRNPHDPRGLLVFRFLEVIRDRRPTAFVMENVPGLAASRVGPDRLPHVLRREYERLGYHVTEMKLNAADYLVPQLRKRLFMVGSLEGPVRPPDPLRFSRVVYGIENATVDRSASAAIGDLGPVVGKGERSPYVAKEPSFFAALMRSENLTDVSLHEMPRMSATDRLLVEHVPPGGNYTDIPDSVATPRIRKFKATGGRTTTYGRLHPDRPSFTINTYFRRPNVGCNFHYAEQRLITAREAMRFQAIPDTFELSYTSQDERNTLIGNAVPSILGRAVAWALKNHLTGIDSADEPGQLSFASLTDPSA